MALWNFLNISSVQVTSVVHDKGYTPLHSAAQNGHSEVCKVILGHVPEKNPKTKDGSTPLLFAARQGLYDVCKIILDNVEDKNPKNNFGMTPLKLATTYGHSAVAKLISSYLEEWKQDIWRYFPRKPRIHEYFSLIWSDAR